MFFSLFFSLQAEKKGRIKLLGSEISKSDNDDEESSSCSKGVDSSCTKGGTYAMLVYRFHHRLADVEEYILHSFSYKEPSSRAQFL